MQIFNGPAYAYGRVKTRLREERRYVRNHIGTSSDEAPSLYQALRAAEALGRLISLASGGRYQLAVVRSYDVQEKTQEGWYKGHLVKSSQIHEPIMTTLTRERLLKDEETEKAQRIRESFATK